MKITTKAGIPIKEYDAIHVWLRHHYGEAKKCDNIACLGDSFAFQWAKKRNCSYAKDRNNFIQLCLTCHRNYDKRPERKHPHELVLFKALITQEQKKFLTSKANRQKGSKLIREALKDKYNV